MIQRARRPRRPHRALPAVHPPPDVHAGALRLPRRSLPGRRGDELADARAPVPRAARRGRPGARGGVPACRAPLTPVPQGEALVAWALSGAACARRARDVQPGRPGRAGPRLARRPRGRAQPGGRPLNVPIALVAIALTLVAVPALPRRRGGSAGAGDRSLHRRRVARSRRPGRPRRAARQRRPRARRPARVRPDALATRRAGAGFAPRRPGTRRARPSPPSVVLASLPWFAAELGLHFPGDVFMAEEPALDDDGTPIAAVHLGHQHGTDGALLVLTALLSRGCACPPAALRIAVAVYLGAMLSYGAVNLVQDLARAGRQARLDRARTRAALEPGRRPIWASSSSLSRRSPLARCFARISCNAHMATARMVFLGFGKYARADKIYALEPLVGDERGGGRRTSVWVEGVEEPRRRLADRAHDPPRHGPRGRRLGRARRGARPRASGLRRPRRRAGSTSATSGGGRAACSRRRRGRARPSSSSEPQAAAFFARDVHEVARDLVGATLLVDGVGGTLVEVEAYAPRRPREPLVPRPHAPRTRPCSARRGRSTSTARTGSTGARTSSAARRGAVPRCSSARSSRRTGSTTMRARRGLDDPLLLCSGPGRLTQALGITRRARRPAARPDAVRAPAARAAASTSSPARGSASRGRRTCRGATRSGARRSSAVPDHEPDPHLRRAVRRRASASAAAPSPAARRASTTRTRSLSRANLAARRRRGSSRRSSGRARAAPSRRRACT